MIDSQTGHIKLFADPNKCLGSRKDGSLVLSKCSDPDCMTCLDRWGNAHVPVHNKVISKLKSPYGDLDLVTWMGLEISWADNLEDYYYFLYNVHVLSIPNWSKKPKNFQSNIGTCVICFDLHSVRTLPNKILLDNGQIMPNSFPLIDWLNLEAHLTFIHDSCLKCKKKTFIKH